MAAPEYANEKSTYRVEFTSCDFKSRMSERVVAATANEAIRVVTRQHGCDVDIVNVERVVSTT